MTDDGPWTGLPGDLLERAGYGIEWCDEWTDCCNCGKVVRTSPDSYFWWPQWYWLSECEIECRQCALADLDSYAEWLMAKPGRVDELRVQWDEHGWAELPEKFWWITGVTAGPTPTVERMESVNVVIQRDHTTSVPDAIKVWIKQPQLD